MFLADDLIRLTQWDQVWASHLTDNCSQSIALFCVKHARLHLHKIHKQRWAETCNQTMVMYNPYCTVYSPNQCISTNPGFIHIQTVTITPNSICIKWILISAIYHWMIANPHCMLIISQSPVTAMKCHCLAPPSNHTATHLKECKFISLSTVDLDRTEINHSG